MFEVNGVYANRKGEYTVLSINPPKMRVRYADGTEAELKMELQERIWENILVEREAEKASRRKKRGKKGIGYYIKVVNIPEEDDLTFPGWPERVVMGPPPETAISLNQDDRLIFYDMESKTFFAVATVTGPGKTANPQKYFFTAVAEKREFFPIDVDAAAIKLEHGAPVEAIELESQPNFRHLELEPESFLPINEDDFELLAEALSEVAEDELEDDSLLADFIEEEEEI
ncbi:MAG TPA: EVE domain-containing protein [Chloroflexi bacterium]|nr:EVE domain-containing protein [Chloroflexota bacterium]